MKRFIHWGTILALSGLLIVQSLAVYVYQRDQRFLRALADRIAPSSLPPSEQTKLILSYFRDQPDDENHGYLFLPIFEFLRPTPRQIAESGGWCSDRSRLLVVLLDLRGIHSEKWALYSPRLIPRHAVVEVDTEQGKMVADPLFGLWFPRPGGGYYGIEDLRAQPRILKDRVEELVARGEDPGSQPVNQYPVDRYTYAQARTINWEKNFVSGVAYNVLHLVLGRRVDQIPRPEWAEQPALMLTFAIIPLELFLLIAFLRSQEAKRAKQEPVPVKSPAVPREQEKEPAGSTEIEEYSSTARETR